MARLVNRPRVPGVPDDLIVVDIAEMKTALPVAQQTLDDDTLFEAALRSRLHAITVEPALVHIGARVGRALYQLGVRADDVEGLVGLFVTTMAYKAALAVVENIDAYLSWRRVDAATGELELGLWLDERPPSPWLDLHPIFIAIGEEHWTDLVGRALMHVATNGGADVDH